MDRLFEREIGKELLLYLDYILIFAEMPEELHPALQRTLQIVIKARLKCRTRKSGYVELSENSSDT